MLDFTGHPFTDVGLATILAYVQKEQPDELTTADLETAAAFLEEEYLKQPLLSYLTVAFTANGYNQPSWNNFPEKRLDYAREWLRAFADTGPPLNQACIFTGSPAQRIAYRAQIPLLTGVDVFNFFPLGKAGLPVSGEAILCIQAAPLGAAKCSGKMLMVHSDDPQITLYFAKTFLQQNRRALFESRISGEGKMGGSLMKPKTLLIETLIAAEMKGKDNREIPASVTAYYLSNSGQDPHLEIFHLPLELTTFLRRMGSASFKKRWNAIAVRAWELPPQKKKKGEKKEEKFAPSRNFLYEDLFDLPFNAARFIRTYFLRRAYRTSYLQDPRTAYSLQQEQELVSWDITQEFLKRIIHMDTKRIESIRHLADDLVGYIIERQDKKFFFNFYTSDRYDFFRNLLIKADLNQARRSNQPLLSLDDYLVIFEEGEEVARVDWRLARDLTLIRMIEQLCEKGWFGQNPDIMPEEDETDAEKTSP